jgi:hypothetical protein
VLGTKPPLGKPKHNDVPRYTDLDTILVVALLTKFRGFDTNDNADHNPSEKQWYEYLGHHQPKIVEYSK